jgi:hypothetical protein
MKINDLLLHHTMTPEKASMKNQADNIFSIMNLCRDETAEWRQL